VILGARLEFVGRLVAGRADLVGAQAVQQVVAPVEDSHVRAEELVGWDTKHRMVGS
jgi:hypothetical protein